MKRTKSTTIDNFFIKKSKVSSFELYIFTVKKNAHDNVIMYVYRELKLVKLFYFILANNCYFNMLRSRFFSFRKANTI